MDRIVILGGGKHANVLADIINYISKVEVGKKTLGKNCKMGVGATVVKDIPGCIVAAGVPAIKLKENE